MQDETQRRRAVDPEISCVVRAPAGSGKTTLLVQRYLRLLALVERPEQVVCITFTRKAAAEMRQRILDELNNKTAEARPVLDADRAKNWQLALMPQRLNIGTIDSLCSHIARRMPLSTGQSDALGREPLAANHQILANPKDLYRRTVVEFLTSPQPCKGVELLLELCGGNAVRLAGLLLEILEQRGNWLQTLVGTEPEHLREGLLVLAQETLESLEALLVQVLGDGWPEALGLTDKSPDMQGDWFSWLHWWQQVAGKLLTKREVLRQRGPARSFAEHPQLPELLHGLSTLNRLPDDPQDPNWITDVRGVLLRLTALLNINMAQERVADYTAVMLAADAALGNDAQGWSDLSLALDYQIQHILMDEYQDTSPLQLRLLEKLVSGWIPGDGRTLMLVGDMAQSCYAFRNARPGLFAQVARHGVGPIRLENLELSSNFRSSGSLINWYNEVFASAFPQQSDVNTGAANYVPMRAANNSVAEGPIEFHLTEYQSSGDRDLARASTAQRVAEVIDRALQSLPDPTAGAPAMAEHLVGVLVRKYKDMEPVMRALRNRGINYSTSAETGEATTPAVRALIALARTLYNPNDRIGWIAVLRGPLCGLHWNDLHKLAGRISGREHESIAAALTDTGQLSEQGRARARHLADILVACTAEDLAVPLPMRTLRAWHQLGGHLVWPESSDWIHPLLRVLEAVSTDSWHLLEQRMFEAVPPTRSAARVQLLTIHKAKGLEFGAVVVPELTTQPGHFNRPLVLIDQWADCSGGYYPQIGLRDGNPYLYQYIAWQEQERARLETQRLLYIAVTRAQQQLYLLATAPRQKSSTTLWSTVPDMESLVTHRHAISTERQRTEAIGGDILQRIPIRALPLRPQPLPAMQRSPPPVQLPGRRDRALGTLVHALLAEVVEEGADIWRRRLQAERGALAGHWRMRLSALGVSPVELDGCIERVFAAMDGALGDTDRGWIFVDSELDALSGAEVGMGFRDQAGGYVYERRMDRCLVDTADTRWVIDYKVSKPGPGQRFEDFIAEQIDSYRDQLNGYLALVQAIEPERKCFRAALYFPELPYLTELESPTIPDREA